ncbi:MAG: flagellar protein [Proteobacteria bacterium]|nr:MAG: flagellar protein [Pseudomonadota bacterium]
MANDLLIPKIGPMPQPSGDVAARGPAGKAGGPAFDRLFRDVLTGRPELANGNAAVKEAPGTLKFSAHATNRLRERSIPMNGELMSKLEKAIDTAAAKGSKETLVLSQDAAFIVSVKNKTVITVVDRNQMAGNVFTNIDSTVVI